MHSDSSEIPRVLGPFDDGKDSIVHGTTNPTQVMPEVKTRRDSPSKSSNLRLRGVGEEQRVAAAMEECLSTPQCHRLAGSSRHPPFTADD